MKKEYVTATSLPLALAGLVLLAGCDASEFFQISAWQKKNAAEQERSLRAEEKETASAIGRARQQAQVKVSAKVATLKATVAACKSALASAEADRATLAARTAAICASEKMTRPAALSALLGDETVNRLATRYLDLDFRMTKLSFDEASEDLIARQKAHRDARAANEEELANVRKESAASVREMRDQAARGMATVQAELKRLESRADHLEREITGMAASSATRDARSEKRAVLARIKAQIATLRSRYDDYNSALAVSAAASKEAREADRRIREAEQRYLRTADRLDREYAKLGDLAKLTCEYEKMTIDVLNVSLAETVRRHGEFLKRAEACLAVAEGLVPLVEKLDESGLRDACRDLDQRIDALEERTRLEPKGKKAP